ncbi:MAG: phage tail protein [Bacteroidales bacterium]|nr:phage tail protein [Bacteroidales bacterium]
MATRYDGLIIPRTYNDYFPRSAPNEIVEVLKNSGEVWPVESGGTGANNAAEARENLGIIVDDALDATSENPVQNKVLTALIPEDSTGLVDIGDFNALSDDVADIAEKIPTQASATNQLADKDFVNSSISTNTANYIYKTNAAGDHIPFDSVEELEAYSGTVTPNDYAIVTGIDENGNIYYDRYKANVSGGVVTWGKEYRLNNSSFTAEQWAAIQSGITAELVALIGQASGSSPIGTILPYIGSSAPAGFLFFDGNDYNGEDYPQLYAKVRNLPAFASETDGYFKLPDLAGRVLQGATIENLGELIAAGLPNITGEWQRGYDNENTTIDNDTIGAFYKAGPIRSAKVYANSAGNYAGAQRLGFDASRANAIYGNSDTVQQAALAINYMIKATNTNESLDDIIDDSTTDVGHAWSGAKTKIEIDNSRKWKKIFDNPTRQSLATITLDEDITNYNEIMILITRTGGSVTTPFIFPVEVIQTLTDTSAIGLPSYSSDYIYLKYTDAHTLTRTAFSGMIIHSVYVR